MTKVTIFGNFDGVKVKNMATPALFLALTTENVMDYPPGAKNAVTARAVQKSGEIDPRFFNGSFCLMQKDEAERLFSEMADLARGQDAQKQCATLGSSAFLAVWDIGGGTALLMEGASGSHNYGTLDPLHPDRAGNMGYAGVYAPFDRQWFTAGWNSAGFDKKTKDIFKGLEDRSPVPPPPLRKKPSPPGF